MSYAKISVDVDDLLANMNREEILEMVGDFVEGGYAPEGWIRETRLPKLDNPVVLFATIEKLRTMGYTVEPGGVE